MKASLGPGGPGQGGSQPPPGALRSLVYITLIIGLSGCPEGGPPRGLDAGAAGTDAGAVAVEAPPLDAGPRELRLTLLAFQVDGGVAGPFEAGGTSVPLELGTAAQLQVQLPPLSDVRVRLFDEADRVLQSDDVLESVDGGLDVRIGLLQALRPGSSYRLLVDAQTDAVLRDPAGSAYADLEVSLKVLGTPEPEPKAAGKKSKGPGKAGKPKRR